MAKRKAIVKEIKKFQTDCDEGNVIKTDEKISVIIYPSITEPKQITMTQDKIVIGS